MKKKIFILILILLVASISLIAYLGKTVLPSKIKTELVKILEDRLQRKFELGEIKFNILKGVILEDLTIYDNPQYSQQPFLKIKEAAVNISWFSIIFQGKFIASSININKAQLNIIHINKDLWNFSDIIERLSKKDVKGPTFLVYNISLSKTQVLWEDKTLPEPLIETIDDINLKANISLNLEIKFNLDAQFKNKDLYSPLYSNGTYDIKNKKLLAYVKVQEVALSEYYPYFKIEPLGLKDGKLKDADIKLTFDNNRLETFIKTKIEALNLQYQNLEFLGSLGADAKISYDPESKDKLLFSGNVTMAASSLKGIALIDSIDNVSGNIAFDTNKIQTQNLTGIVLNCPTQLSGVIENFRNPALNISINSDIKISDISGLIPQEIKSNFSEIDGNIKLDLNMKGELRQIKALDYAGKAKFKDAYLKLNILTEKIIGIQADIDFNKDGITWTGLSCSYKNINFTTDGSMKGFINPIIETEIKSDIVNLKAKINTDKNTVGVSWLEGKYLNSTFNITGSVDITEQTNPILNLAVNLDAQLNDLKDVLSKFKENLQKANLDGLCNIKGNLAGKLHDWQSWQTNLVLSSPIISIYGFKLNNTQIQLTQTQNMIKDCNLASSVYGGILNISLAMNLKDNFPFLLNASAADIDLSKLILDTPLKDKPISGILALRTQINGNAQDILAINGNGRLEMKDGALWELSLLKGLGNFLFIREFNNIIFNAANGDFIIENKTIQTDNLKFISNELALACQGKLDFESNLDFLITTQFSQELVNESEDLRRVITSAIGKVADVVSVKLTGTLEKPKYTIIVNPIDLLKKILKGLDLNVL